MDKAKQYPNAVITFVIAYDNKFLLVCRGKEKNFSNLRAFPGGKVEIGETAIETISREIKEETNLDIKDEGFFLNSYKFGTSVGFCFLVRAKHDNVILGDGLLDYAWIEMMEDMSKFNCIPGIYNHLARAFEIINLGRVDSLKNMNLTPDVYINQN